MEDELNCGGRSKPFGRSKNEPGLCMSEPELDRYLVPKASPNLSGVRDRGLYSETFGLGGY
jgi:hypothetical protein